MRKAYIRRLERGEIYEFRPYRQNQTRFRRLNIKLYPNVIDKLALQVVEGRTLAEQLEVERGA